MDGRWCRTLVGPTGNSSSAVMNKHQSRNKTDCADLLNNAITEKVKPCVFESNKVLRASHKKHQ